MPKSLNYYKYYAPYELLEELNKLVTQVKDLFDKSGYCPEEHSKLPLSAELMAAYSAALAAAAASKSGVWCKNVNQNGVANISNIYPDHD